MAALWQAPLELPAGESNCRTVDTLQRARVLPSGLHAKKTWPPPHSPISLRAASLRSTSLRSSFDVTFELAKHPLCVQVINFLQHRIGQSQAVDFPAPLCRIAPVVERFVSGLKPAKLIAVHGFVHAIVSAEHHPVLILEKKLAGLCRLPSQLCFARAKLDHDIRVLVEHARHPIQILGPTHVQRNEERFRGSRKNPVTG